MCGLLRSVASADFATIRTTLELSDVSLSKTLRTLVEVGYVRTVKVASPARPDRRTTYHHCQPHPTRPTHLRRAPQRASQPRQATSEQRLRLIVSLRVVGRRCSGW
ncbi:transcriptional regulator [Cryobacterium fucosi]|uniref:transcriptional regulator n=1 Tax=Cryobacterium fucosi TaxID=1259157 RepID=UPI001F53EA65|nr:transcriptional regulator [Cryobacterium fucosi]